MEVLLVDTGPLVAIVNKRDKFHLGCLEYLKNYRGRLLTTWAVLTEFAHMADSIGATLPLYHWIERGGLELMPLGREELVTAIDWIERYADRPMDLADASLVVAALKTGSTQIWTLDRDDFETYRLPGRKHFKLV
ncbi:MAG: PIN domain-containing protein [Azonexus sp.]|nr:PIN domain-containing protein [Azonexus sp.]